MKVYYHATLLHLLKDYYYRIAMSYLLAKLSQCILNSTNGLVVNEVYVLQNGKCTNFVNDSGKQTIHSKRYGQTQNTALPLQIMRCNFKEHILFVIVYAIPNPFVHSPQRKTLSNYHFARKYMNTADYWDEENV